jgi:hypothetical protein
MKSFLLLINQNKCQLRKELFRPLIKSIEMLKAIEVEFKCKKFLINKWVVLVNRFTCEHITRLIESAMPAVHKIKKQPAQNNMLTLIMTILECYKGGYNALRRNVVRHAMNLIPEEVFDKVKLAEFS